MRKVTVLGTWRAIPDSELYKQAEMVGSIAARHGYAVITGAYSGVMEAAAKGARSSGGYAIGYSWSRLSAQLAPNPYLNEVVEFESGAMRIAKLIEDADICVFFPGRTGTLAELALATELRAKGEKEFPVVLVGDYWRGFYDWLRVSNDQLPFEIDKQGAALYVIVTVLDQIDAIFAKR